MRRKNSQCRHARAAAGALRRECRNSCTLLPPFVCLGQGTYRVSGVPRMHERPQASLIQALRELGYRIDSANDRLPAIIHGTGPRHAATCSVSVGSQFALVRPFASTGTELRSYSMISSAVTRIGASERESR